MENKLINNVKKSKVSRSEYGNSTYRCLFYCDNENKICVSFTPRGGCSISFKQYLDIVGLLKDAEDYNSFVHHYRQDIFVPNISFIPINKLIEQNLHLLNL